MPVSESFTYPEGMSTSFPSLNWLRVFEVAARHESFTRAAQELNMSAPAVSQQIKALETQLGINLFKRAAHSVSLTQTGHAYLPAVQQALAHLETATEGLFAKSRKEHVFIQSVLLFAQGLLVPKLTAFENEYPNINLRLNTGNVQADFKRDFSDLMIIFGAPSYYGTESDRLMGEMLYPVAHPNVAKEIKNPKDLLRFPLIEVATHRTGWAQFFDAHAVRSTRAKFIYTDSSIMAFTLAEHSTKIALARAPASDYAMQTAGLVPCLPDYAIEGVQSYHIIYADRTNMRPAVRKTRDWLLDTFAHA